jgi:hypothetical protein
VRIVAAVRARRWRELARLGVVLAAWLASFAVVAVLTWRSVRGNPTMTRLWTKAFAPSPLDPSASRWYRRTLVDLVRMAFARAGPRALAAGLWWPPWLDVVVPLAAALGLATLLWQRPRVGAWLLITLGTALIASAAGRYPLAGRLLLFAVPLLFVCLAAFAELFANQRPAWAHAAGWGVAVGCIALVMGPAAAIARRPLGGADVKGALAYVQVHAAPGDRLAVSAWSAPAVRFYAGRFALDRLAATPPVPPAFDAAVFLADLRRAHASGRVWIVLSHRYEKGRAFVADLRRDAQLLDAWEGDGAGAFLLGVPP